MTGAAASLPAREQLHLLILEDNALDAKLEVSELEEAGYVCHWERVQTREAFCARLQNAELDLIVADYSMPGFDGLSAVRIVRDLGWDIPFILVSGTIGEEVVVEMLRAGATDYVLKTRIARLGPVVHRAFRERDERRERQRCEAELKQQSALLQGVLDSMGDSVIVVGANARFLVFNPAAERLFGPLPAGSVLGGWAKTVGLHLADGTTPCPVDRNPLALALRGASIDGAEFVIRKPGEVEARRMTVTGRPLAAADAALRGGVVVFRDTTELSRTREELARSNTELERFAYIASHDLQEPLRMVASYTQLLAKRYRGRLDADADEFIGYAIDGAVRMKTLIDDLLEYSRVGTTSKAFAETDCEAVLDRCLLDLHPAIAESEAVVTHNPLPTVSADCGQLAQLIQNLLSNAIKFRGTAPPQVHIGATRQAGAWLFTVRDNGIGIAAQFSEEIFVVFKRLHGRTEYPGTGIGLAICKRIVERHGGRLWVESHAGAGSTFCFTISDPALIAAAAATGMTREGDAT